MALSRIVAIGDGSTKTFTVAFALGYLNEDDVTCRVGDEADGVGNPLYRTITWLTPTQAQISGAAPESGVRVIFERSVPRDQLLVDFEDNDIINEDTMNTAQKQALMLVHEVLDGRFHALNINLNMGTFQMKNLGAPTDPYDAATKEYVDTQISTGASNAAAAAASASAAAASASAAASSVSAAFGVVTDATQQRDYAHKWATEAAGVDVDDGVNPVGKSAYHWAMVAEGMATGALPNNSVSTASIQDGAVTEEKLAPGLLDSIQDAAVTAAEDAADRAEAAVASINIPPIASGDAGKTLVVKEDDSGFELVLSTTRISTRTLMKAIPVLAAGQTVFLTEAGREGTFILRTGSPPVSDTQEGIYVVSNTAGFYWERLYAPKRVPSISAFGAKLDGVTDDSNAIKGALAVCGEAYIPRTSTGFVAGDIDVNPGLGHVISTSGCPTWKIKSTAACAIRVVPAAVAGQYARIGMFRYDGQAAPNTSGAILINTSAGIVLGLRVEGIIAKDCGFAYREEDSVSNYVVDFTIGDTLCYFTRGRQIDSRRSRGFFNWRDIKVDNTYNITGGRPSVTWNSIYFADMIGLEFNQMDVVGDVPGTGRAYQAAAIGVIIYGVVAGRGSIYGRRILVDNTTGPGVLIANCFNLEVDIIQAYQNLGPGIEMQGVSKSVFSKVKAVGGIGLVNAPASSHGLSMSSCSAVTIVGFEAEQNTGSGSVMVSCSDCKILGGYSNSNTGSGFVEATAATRNLRVGVSALSNGGSSLVQIGAQSATSLWYANGGTHIVSNVGSITV